MPDLNLDSLDDDLVAEQCAGFAGGQHSASPPETLQPLEAALLLNMDIRDGSATTRRGHAALGTARPGPVQGLCWYHTAAAAHLVAVAGGRLHFWNGEAWSLGPAYPTGSPGNLIAFAQLGDSLFLADGTLPLHAWNGTTLSSPGTGPSSPPVGRLLLSAQNRLWMAGVPTAPDTLFTSALLNGTQWDATTQALRIGAEDGEPITGLVDWDDYQVVVFKRTSIFIVRADPALTAGGSTAPLSGATVTKISGTVGCVAPRSIARVGNDVWFLAEGGVHTIGRVLAQPVREVRPPVSQAIQDVLERVSWPQAERSAAVCWKDRYLLSVPLDGETQPGTVLVYHLLRAAWSGLWTGLQPLAWAATGCGGCRQLVLGRADGQIWRWLDGVPVAAEEAASFRDAGADIPSAVLTRALNFREPAAPKSLFSVEAVFSGSCATATLAASLDEEPPALLAAEVRTGPGELQLPFTAPAALPSRGTRRRTLPAQHLPPCRSVQISIASAAGKLVVRSAGATAFVEAPVGEE